MGRRENLGNEDLVALRGWGGEVEMGEGNLRFQSREEGRGNVVVEEAGFLGRGSLALELAELAFQGRVGPEEAVEVEGIEEEPLIAVGNDEALEAFAVGVGALVAVLQE